MCLCEGVSSCEHLHCQVEGEGGGSERRQQGGLSPSSVVVLGEVQGAQVAEAQPHALHVEGVGLAVLPLQKVLDAVGPLLLDGNQLLLDLRGTQGSYIGGHFNKKKKKYNLPVETEGTSGVLYSDKKSFGGIYPRLKTKQTVMYLMFCTILKEVETIFYQCLNV